MTFSFQKRLSEKSQLWSIAFSPETTIDDTFEDSKGNPGRYQYFATCGGRKVTIYEFEASSNGNFRRLQSYKSPDANEDFYAVTFARRRTHDSEQQLLCVGGRSGNILVIEIVHGNLLFTLKGSPGCIFDLKSIHCETDTDREYNLLCSCTSDQSRVWNLDTFAIVAILRSFPNGDIGDVYSCAWHATGGRIVTGGGPPDPGEVRQGFEHQKFQICVWNILDNPRLTEAIQASSYLPEGRITDRSQFNPHDVRFATSVHSDVHTDMVDCVDWMGDLILSKSTFSEIILWKPLPQTDAKQSSILPVKIFRYAYVDNRLSFMRFAISDSHLAIGNDAGHVYLWDLKDFDSTECSQFLPFRGKKKDATVIRGLSFSPDGRNLIGCQENGGILLWSQDRITSKKPATRKKVAERSKDPPNRARPSLKQDPSRSIKGPPRASLTPESRNPIDGASGQSSNNPSKSPIAVARKQKKPTKNSVSEVQKHSNERKVNDSNSKSRKQRTVAHSSPPGSSSREQKMKASRDVSKTKPTNGGAQSKLQRDSVPSFLSAFSPSSASGTFLSSSTSDPNRNPKRAKSLKSTESADTSGQKMPGLSNVDAIDLSLETTSLSSVEIQIIDLTSADSPTTEWSCHRCTFRNQGRHRNKCEMCDQERT